jgi:hypothetical protein
MKKLLFTLLIAFATVSMQANDFGFGLKSPNKKAKSNYSYTVDEGNMIISLGYGAPNFRLGLYDNEITNQILNSTATGLGPIHAKFEYMINDRFGVGLVMNHVSAVWEYQEDFGGGNYLQL